MCPPVAGIDNSHSLSERSLTCRGSIRQRLETLRGQAFPVLDG